MCRGKYYADPISREIDLRVSAYKVRGTQYAGLTWSGAASTNVDIYCVVYAAATTENDGFYNAPTCPVKGGSAT